MEIRAVTYPTDGRLTQILWIACELIGCFYMSMVASESFYQPARRGSENDRHLAFFFSSYSHDHRTTIVWVAFCFRRNCFVRSLCGRACVAKNSIQIIRNFRSAGVKYDRIRNRTLYGEDICENTLWLFCRQCKAPNSCAFANENGLGPLYVYKRAVIRTHSFMTKQTYAREVETLIFNAISVFFLCMQSVWSDHCLKLQTQLNLGIDRRCRQTLTLLSDRVFS